MGLQVSHLLIDLMTIFVLRQATITLRIMVYLELLQLEQARLPTSFNILDFLDHIFQSKVLSLVLKLLK